MTTPNEGAPPPPPAAAPKNAPAAEPASARPGENAHAEQTPAPKNPPPAFDPSKAGLVYRDGADGKPGRWVRPVKADGKEVDVALDDDETWNNVSGAVSWRKRMAEADRKAKEADGREAEILRRVQHALLHEDPRKLRRAALMDAGIDPDQYEREQEAERARLESLTPEGREADLARRQAEEYRAELERRDRDAQAQQLASRTREQLAANRAAMSTAMTTAGLDAQDPHLMLAMVTRLRVQYMRDKNAPQDFDRAAADVRSLARKGFASTLPRVPDEELLSYLGEENLKRIHRLAAAQAAKKPDAPPPPAPLSTGGQRAPRGTPPEREPTTPGEKIAALRAKNGGRTLHRGI